MKLTEWFPNSIKPVRKGWYEMGCKGPGGIQMLAYPYHFYDGRYWCDCQQKPLPEYNKTDTHDMNYMAGFSCFWRGIIKDKA